MRITESIDKGICNKEFTWIPSNCESEYEESCDIGEYVDYKKRRNKVVDKLLEKCSEDIDGNEILYNETLNAIPLNTIPLNTKTCNSCTIYIVLFVIFFIISISISSVFI